MTEEKIDPYDVSKFEGIVPSELAIAIAAQCWCDDDTGHIEMDVELATAFAKRITAYMGGYDQNDKLATWILQNASEEIIDGGAGEVAIAYMEKLRFQLAVHSADPISRKF